MSARRLLALGLTAMALALAAGASVQALPAGRVSGAPPTVQSMIVGSAGAILSPARTVTADATTVRVHGRTCAVAAGTPLAVLAAMRRAGGPGFALRDYGHCGASPKDSAELFVDSLAGEANSGQDGWEYKVDSVAGSTGAADTSGPMGDGRRLSSGQRVLWFWCNATGGGCQRTLEVAPSTLAVSPGASLTVTVTGYENEGRGTPIGGASVALGLHTATTSASGRASLVAPSAPGRYAVSATRRGLVPSFPETIVVR
jgi:hypothetical protein